MSNPKTDTGPNYQYGWSLLTNEYLFQIEHYLYSANPPTPSVLQFPSFLDHLFKPFPELEELYVNLRWSSTDRLQRHQVHGWLTRISANMPKVGVGNWQLMAASMTLVEIMQYIVDNWDKHQPHWMTKEQLSPVWVALDRIINEKTTGFPLTEIVDKMGKGDELQEQARRDTAAVQTIRDELAKRHGEDNVSEVLTKIEGEKDSPLVTECRKAVEDHINYTSSLKGTSKEEITGQEDVWPKRTAMVKKAQKIADAMGTTFDSPKETTKEESELEERALELKFQTKDLEPNGDTAPTPEEKEIAKKKIFDDIEASSKASRLQELHKREGELEEIYILTTKEMKEVGNKIWELQNPGCKASDFIYTPPDLQKLTYESLTNEDLIKMIKDLFYGEKR